MKRYIIFLLFFINFIPIYTDGNWFFDIGFRAFAYYDESENWNDNYYDYGDGFYEIGGNLCYDGNGDGYIDSILYHDSDGYPVIVILGNGGNQDPNDDWHIDNDSIGNNVDNLVNGSSGSDEWDVSGGGGGGGSGSSSGGGNSGNHSSGTILDDPYLSSDDFIPEARLKFEVKEAIKFGIENYGEDMACCNISVRTIFKGLYNSNELDNMRANDMVEHWRRTPAHWEPIEMDKAQELANSGYFVVAGYFATKGSGHVVVIMPGEMSYSGTWKCLVPNTMDTGKEMRTEFQSFSYSFGSNKKGHVEFYYYK